MRISLEWIGEYVDLPTDKTAAQIAHDLTMTTVEVESIIRLDEGLSHVVAGRVTEASAGVATVHVGSGSLRPIEARVMPAVGAMVAVSIEPAASFISAADLGVAELFAQKASDPLSLDEFPCSPGDNVARLLGWNDVVFDIDNKSVTHRPDLWGHYGIARELAAFYQKPLKPLRGKPYEIPAGTLLGDIDSTVCRRFTAAMISNVRPSDAPFWMRSRLWRVGQRPRNFFADLTNYVMLATGQPCHAFDAAKLTLPLSVRRAAEGEVFSSLDGTTNTLGTSDFVVADAKSAVGLAGVIGGAESAISSTTTDVLLEMANFDPRIVRKMSAGTGIRTEASTRFEKGLATQRIDETRRLLFDIVKEVHPEAVFTANDDRRIAETVPATIVAHADYLCGRIGKDLSPAELSEPLERLGFTVSVSGRDLTVGVPDWRSTGDVSGPHDLVEEIARLYGYENFDFQPPAVHLLRTARDYAAGTERRLKEFLAFSCGLQEVISYPWTEDRFVKAGGNPALGEPLRLSAPPSPDQGTLRTSLIPGLLRNVDQNLRWSSDVRLFETGALFASQGFASLDDTREQLPAQRRAVAVALAGSDPVALFYEAKGIIEAISRRIHVAPIVTDVGPAAPWADAAANAVVLSGGEQVGWLGLLNRRAARDAGIKRGHVVLFEIELGGLKALPSRDNAYASLPVFPAVDIDVSLVYPDSITWRQVAQTVSSIDPLIAEVHFVSEFRGGKVPQGHRSLALRARLQAGDRTLTSDEANAIGRAIMTTATEKLGAIMP